MSYAAYEGDSRSAWERLDWVSWHVDYVRSASLPERKEEAENLREIAREVEPLIIESKGINNLSHSYSTIWAKIGYIVVFGLAVTVFGVLLRFIVSGPFPFALAAFGMGFVVIALYYGKIIDENPTAM